MTALVIGRKAAQERFSEENFRLDSFYTPEMHFSTALPQASAQLGGISRHTASLDELAELINYSKRLETSSTHLFASHGRELSDAAKLLLQDNQRGLLNPAPASTL